MINLLKKIKRKIYSYLLKFVCIYWEHHFKKNIIIFESVPDFSDNTRYVFDEFIRRKLYNKFNLLWLAYDKKNKISIENSELIYENPENIIQKGKTEIACKNAVAYICCNRFKIKKGQKQSSFYLSHGTTIKDISNYYFLLDEVDYCFCSSPNTIDLSEYSFKVKREKIFPLGFPRNESFFKPPIDIKQYFKHNYDKIIVWYPTFRKEVGYLPLLHNINDFIDLNNFCKLQNILIVIKYHFHDCINDSKNKFDNIIFIDDNFFSRNNILSYDFVNSTDALITDYSSIYFDYLICNKPIGVIWEDIEQYRQNPGFAIDLNKYLAGAIKIYTLDEFKRFISDVKNEKDTLSKIRKEISEYINSSCSKDTSKNIVDFILNKIKK